MKKFQLLTKSLLVAAGLLMGASAWADATVIYGRAMTADATNGYTAWSASDIATEGQNVWIGNFAYNETYGLYASGTGARSSVMTFSHTENSLQTFDIVFDNLGNTGNAANYSYIKIGSGIEIQSNQQNQNGTVIINGVSSSISDCNKKNYNRGGDKWTIHIEINTAQNKVTALTITGTEMNGKSAHFTLSDETSLGNSATYNTVTIGFTRSGGTPSAALTSIRIAEEEQAVTTTNYTINYKSGETIVKTVNGSSTVGTVITADAAIDGDDNNHYLITDNDAPSMTLAAGSNILDVPVRAPYTATLKVTTIVGTEDPDVVTTTCVETDNKVCSWTYVYPLYKKVNGIYYIADETSSFGETGTFTDGEIINKTVEYSNVAASVLYFNEESTAGTNIALSNGGTTYAASGNSFNGSGMALGSYSAGTYMITAYLTANGNRGLYVHNNTETILANLGIDKNSSAGLYSAIFTLTKETSLNLTGYTNSQNKPNQSADFDYVVIKKINSMSIVGDFSANGWEPDQGIALTQDENDHAIWKATVDDFNVTSAKYFYQYKAVANGNWNDYVLGNPNASNTDKNQEYDFDYDGARVGTYYLMFTVNTTAHTVELAVEKKHAWTVAGNNATLFGTAWAADATDNDMTRNDEGIWTITYKNKALTAGTIEYKIVQDHSWDNTSYGYNGNNATAEIPADGTYNVVFTFNASTTATGCEIVPTTVTKNITDAGYATYYSPYALDFSSTGLTAYIAKLNGSEVAFTEVTKVPAYTGVLLKGAAGDYNISTTLDATDDVTGNVLKGVLADTEVPAGSFVLLKGDKGVGFYKTTAAFTVGANTAYFEALPTTARFIGFDDMTTAIENVNVNVNVNEIYDLQGRRVVAPQKGLYIINGKKVVLK